ncbi:MAG: ArsR family transcriptional regulator [Cyanobacteria bacterium RYN_339]|nr:ArsR family transcriptional regulator [Cyanobacteria bacterium RYN_339]
MPQDPQDEPDDDELSPIWKALSDLTRRRLLDALRAGPQTTGALCARFPKLARVTVIKHLGILEAADLIVVQAKGRERWNYLNAVPIQRIYERWIGPFEAHWASALLRFQAHVEGDRPL